MLHGGQVDCGSGAFKFELAHQCVNGTIRCSLLAASLVLSDHPAGAGGFCVVPGSHKSNFAAPEEMIHGLTADQFVARILKQFELATSGMNKVCTIYSGALRKVRQFEGLLQRPCTPT